MTVTLKPFDDMPLHDLYRDLRLWNELIVSIHGSGPAVAIALEQRNKCAAAIRNRLAQIGAVA